MKNSLATVVLFSYNQEMYVREAIEGAVSQTYSPLEIIISDDASTDKTWNIIQDTVRDYKGPHKLIVRRNNRNLGINEHFNKLITLVNGEYIVIMAGDDISKVNRVKVSVEALKQNNVFGLFANGMKINQEGHEISLFMKKSYQGKSWLDMINAGSNGGSGYSMAWRRSVTDLFPAIPSKPLGEDAFIPFRCALLGGLSYLDKDLVQYRVHANNCSFWSKLSSADSAKDRLSIARVEIKHFIQMQEYRLEDIQLALDKGFISEKEAQMGNECIERWVKREQTKLSILMGSFLQVSWKLFKARRDLNADRKHFPALHFWYRCSKYFFPRLYALIHTVLRQVK